MRIAALVPFGDPHESDDWAVYQVPEIQIMSVPPDFTDDS